MSNLQSWKNLKFEAQASYRIRVQGHLDDNGSDRMGGMVLTRAFTADKQPMTILIGQLKDQAALSGVMNAIYLGIAGGCLNRVNGMIKYRKLMPVLSC